MNLYIAIGVLSIIVAGLSLSVLVLGYKLHRPSRANQESPRCSLFSREHDWSYSENRGKRSCLNCGREEWLFQDHYPRIGEPALSWRDMTLPKKK